MGTVNLFTTPVQCFDNLVDPNKIEVLQQAVARYKKQIVDNPKFDHSRAVSRPLMTNLIIQDVRDHVSELNMITDAIDSYVGRYASILTGESNLGVTLTHSWLAIQGSGHYVQRHNHTFVADPTTLVNSIIHINAIFYIAANGGDRLDLYYPNQNMVVTSGTRSLSGIVAGAIECRANRLVLMPSWLDHSVDARPREHDKICLSANYVIRKQN